MEISKKNKKRIIILMMPVVMTAALIYTMSGKAVEEGTGKGIVLQSEETTQMSVDSTDENPEEAVSGDVEIYVDVGGAVENPQVVQIQEGARVFQVIDAAGGLREDSDISGINLASVCEDGQKIYVPSVEESGSAGSFGSSDAGPQYASGTGSGSSGLININTAGSEELQTLSGVGPGIAQKILDYRSSNGMFRTIEDLKNVNGIGEKTFEKLKDHICV